MINSVWRETSVLSRKEGNEDRRRYGVESWRLAVPGGSAGWTGADLLLCGRAHLGPVGAYCLPLCRKVSIHTQHVQTVLAHSCWCCNRFEHCTFSSNLFLI